MAQSVRTTVPQLAKADNIEMGTNAKMEATYGALLDTGDIQTNYRAIADVAPFDPKDEFVGDDEIGDGVEWPSVKYLNRCDLALDLNHRFSSEVAGYMAAMGLGKVTTTPGTNGKTGSYSHAFVPFTISATPATGNAGLAQPPSTSARIKDGPNQYIADGLCLDSVEISGAMGEIGKIASKFIGSGRLTSNTTVFQTPATVNYIKLMKVQIGVAGDEEDVSWAVRDCKFAWKNNLQAAKGYCVGGGLYRNQLLIGKRTYEFTLNLLQHSTDTDLAHYLAKTQMQAILTFQGAAVSGCTVLHDMIITMKNLQIDTRKLAKDESLKRCDFTFNPTGDGSGNFIAVEVQNATAAYLILDT